MNDQLLSNLAVLLQDLQVSLERLHGSVKMQQERMDGVSASQVILFQLLIQHTGVNPADLLGELRQYIEKTPSEHTRRQLAFHLKACEQVIEIMGERRSDA